MIKTALKHWIYEICINQVFDNIGKNFIPIYKFNPKEKYAWLKLCFHDHPHPWIYVFNVTIIKNSAEAVGIKFKGYKRCFKYDLPNKHNFTQKPLIWYVDHKVIIDYKK